MGSVDPGKSFPQWVNNAIALHVSRDMALIHGLVEPTPEEAVGGTEMSRQYQERQRREWLTYDAARPALDSLTDPLARRILALHHAKDVEAPKCDGCDMDGYECERPEWPCRTVRAVAEVYGIDLPAGSYLWQRAPDA